MKYRLAALVTILALMLAGCAPEIEQVREDDQIYASFYPIYALSGLVLEDISGIGLKCLVQPQDDCLRLYDLSDWDASILAYDADAVIIGGRGLESFETALYTFGDSGPAIITATNSLALFNEDGEAGIDGATGHLADANPHLYMSVSGARKMVEKIAEALAQLYPARAGELAAGLQRADARLADLQAEAAEICAGTQGQKVILMNEALIYPALEYGLSVVYRYDRESGTTLYGESLAAAIAEFDETGAQVILIEEHAPAELTRALEEAGYTVVGMDIMSSYSTAAGADGYISAQLENARAIAAAFE